MMHCCSCHEEVDEGRAVRIFTDTARRIVDSESDNYTYEVEVIVGLQFHVRYIGGMLPETPETSPLHGGPVLCGPLE